jgi:hypothetical protein
MSRIRYYPQPRKIYVFGVFLVSYLTTLFKEGKLLNPKKVVLIVNMSEVKTPKDIQVLNGMA